MEEICKDTIGYEGLYQISNLGRIKSLPKKDSINRLVKGKLLSPGPRGRRDAYGKSYLHVGLHYKGRCSYRAIHRLVLEAFVGDCPDGMEGRHIDGNRENNRLDNLCWATHIENERDKKLHGRSNQGSKNGLAKLTENDIPVIRGLLRKGFSLAEIGKKFGVQDEAIRKIGKGQRWNHVKEIF